MLTSSSADVGKVSDLVCVLFSKSKCMFHSDIKMGGLYILQKCSGGGGGGGLRGREEKGVGKLQKKKKKIV